MNAVVDRAGGTHPRTGGPAAPVTLDMTGAACPLPLLGAKRLLDDLPDGQPLRLISDCPGTADDLRAWCSATHYELTSTERLGDGRTVYTLRRALGAGRNPANVVFDLRGSAGLDPVVEARRLLEQMPAGDVLVLVASTPGARGDVDAWVASTAVELIDTFEAAGSTEFYLRRRCA